MTSFKNEFFFSKTVSHVWNVTDIAGGRASTRVLLSVRHNQTSPLFCTALFKVQKRGENRYKTLHISYSRSRHFGALSSITTFTWLLVSSMSWIRCRGIISTFQLHESRILIHQWKLYNAARGWLSTVQNTVCIFYTMVKRGSQSNKQHSVDIHAKKG